MRKLFVTLLAGAPVLAATAAHAADALKFGPPPAWVVQHAIPAAKASDAPVAFLLNDQQVSFDGGKITSYNELAFKIQNAQGLAAGNLSFAWEPSTDTITVNKLQIRRGDKVIDVLGSGQTFTVIRRETNLEAAMLDGTLTANIQPEGLQEGDIIDLATTTEHSDPVLRGHVEATFGAWNEMPIQAAHVLLSSPAGLNLNLRESQGLPVAQHSTRGNRKVTEITTSGIEPLIAPSGAPTRFTIGRLGEATDFASWADVAKLMLPLYRAAAVIPPSGPLREELEKIRSASKDPKVRATQALALVQDRIRYVALLMGQGGYVPASAEQTWSRRFGDCKAKTALLLALLRQLDIDAEPVLVNSSLGDALADRLPMVGVFDHVLVRARIAGKDYWLDGTRTGDTNLDEIRVPNFGWALPLAENAALVHLVPPPLDAPQLETDLDVDASGGVYAAAPAHAEQTLRGDLAVALQLGISSMSDAQRQAAFQAYWGKIFDFVTFRSGSATFDKATRQLHLTMTGDAKLDWSTGYFHVPNSSVGYDANFDRPPGPLHDAPVAVGYPVYSKSVTRLHLPHSFLAGRRFGSADVHETLAGVQYARTAKLDGDILSVEVTEKSVAPEVAYKEAVAAQSRLRKLSDEDVSLPVPGGYRATGADAAALANEKPESADEYVQRGSTYLNAFKFDEAIADFDKALAIDPKNAWAFANRALAHVWRRELTAAEKDLATAKAIDPDNAVLNRARGLIAERNGDCRAAVDAYTASLQAESTNSFALGHRARCELTLGMDAQALADSKQALSREPDWTELHLIRAHIFVRQGNDDAAVAELDQLISKSGNGQAPEGRIGMVYAQLGMRDRAMAAFAKALATNPSADLYLARAEARPVADYQGRRDDIDAALKLDPHNSAAVSAKADLLLSKGETAEALQVYDDASRVITGLSPLTVGRALILYKLGRKAEAQKLLGAWRKGVGTATEFSALCSSKARAGVLLESAADDCKAALHINAQFPPALKSLALVQLRLGQYDEAISMYDRALARWESADAYMGRAIAYARKGDGQHAQADLVTALRLDPDAKARFAEYGVTFDQPAQQSAAAEH